MKINYHLKLLLLIAVSLVLLVGGAYLIKIKTSKKASTKEKIKKGIQKIKRRVGIVSFSSGSVVDKVSESFKHTLNTSQRAEYIFRQSSANGDKVFAQSMVEDLVDSQVDLIFCIGNFCARIAKKITEKRGNPIPVIFSGVTDPARINLVESEESSGNNLTGIADVDMPWEERIDILLTIKPSINNVVIASNFSTGNMLEKEIMTIKNILEARNIHVTIVPIYKKNEVVQKVTPFLTQNCDVLICLRDSTVIDSMDRLVKICDREKITIFSMYLDDVEKGAVLGFGLEEKVFGIKAAQIAQKILEEGTLPRDIPIQRLDSSAYRLQINKQAAAQQGLHLDPTISFLIKNANIV